MKLKKFLTGLLLGMAGLASVYALVQPNIGALTVTTSVDPNLYYLMVQSGNNVTTAVQRKITATNFANNISGLVGGISSQYWTAIDN